jgi:hypothetical protein
MSETNGNPPIEPLDPFSDNLGGFTTRDGKVFDKDGNEVGTEGGGGTEGNQAGG